MERSETEIQREVAIFSQELPRLEESLDSGRKSLTSADMVKPILESLRAIVKKRQSEPDIYNVELENSSIQDSLAIDIHSDIEEYGAYKKLLGNLQFEIDDIRSEAINLYVRFLREAADRMARREREVIVFNVLSQVLRAEESTDLNGNIPHRIFCRFAKEFEKELAGDYGEVES